MLLSELAKVAGVEILRDGTFAGLGLLSHEGPGLLVALYDPAYLEKLLANGQVTCVITRPELAPRLPGRVGVAVAGDARTAFYRVHEHLLTRTDFYWKDFPSEISERAQVHPRACVAAANVRIGPGCRVEPNAVIFERSVLGEEVVIRAGAVIGGEGFEPKYVGGKHVIIPHAGGVRLRDGVEVQANSHVQKAVHGGFTEVGEDTKIDAFVHVGHNVRVGRRCEIAAGALIAGSTVVGDDVWIGPSATISSELRIGSNAFVAIGSVVIRDVPAGARVCGVPARLMVPRQDQAA